MSMLAEARATFSGVMRFLDAQNPEISVIKTEI
jgi:hypothetical protein